MLKKIMVLSIVTSLLCGCSGKQLDEPLQISAASNLTNAFKVIAEEFQQKTGQKVVLQFGATSALGQQLSEGAPVDVFAAADTKTINKLAIDGYVEDVQEFAEGYVVMLVASGMPVVKLADLNKQEVERIIIAQPKTAPYGKATMEVLENSGLLPGIEQKIIYVKDIQSALTYMAEGEADVAFTAKSLVVKKEYKYIDIATGLYSPLMQNICINKNSQKKAVAKDFLSFCLGERGQEILKFYGYGSVIK
ncbi:MAG: molybdate ABC transporter substrate-binding protein [Clostridia bacterium]